jgi:hypothetical protein
MRRFADGLVFVIFNRGTASAEAEALFRSFRFPEDRFINVFCGAPIYLAIVPFGEEEQWVGRFKECRAVGDAARVIDRSSG